MAQACKATGGAGLSHSRGYEDAVNAKISGELIGKDLDKLFLWFIYIVYIFLEVESNLPENIKDRALSVFRSAVSEKYPIIAAIEKVQKEALCEIETVFKGQRFKVRLGICSL